MANDNRICKACGSKYKYCPTCDKYSRMPSWMWRCDTEECNDLFEAISAYKMGLKNNADDIKAVLDMYDIKDYSKFTDSIQKTLNELFPINKYNKKNKFNKRMDIELKEEIAEPVLDEKDVIVTSVPEITVEEISEINGVSDLL